MPYFVFKISQPTQVVKQLEFQEAFDSYKNARDFSRTLRATLANKTSVTPITVKLLFASSQLEAEERLHENREKPILREWEK